MGPEREIEDPLLQRIKLGPDVEPTEKDLLKAPHEGGDVAPTGGPVARRLALPPRGVSASRVSCKILGPGLITGASDDDPSGIGTYSQAGAQFGFGVLWTALFTFPLFYEEKRADDCYARNGRVQADSKLSGVLKRDAL